MSIRCSIGYTDKIHLWLHALGDGLYLERGEETIRVMDENDWLKTRDQIIAAWLQEVSNGYGKLKYVWGTDSSVKLDAEHKERLTRNLAVLVAAAES